MTNHLHPLCMMLDPEIADEKFLVYINDMLSSGIIPDLFAREAPEPAELHIRCFCIANSQGRILAAWILAKFRFEFCRGFFGGFFPPFFSKEKGPKRSTKKSPAKFTRDFVRKNSPRISAEAFSRQQGSCQKEILPVTRHLS